MNTIKALLYLANASSHLLLFLPSHLCPSTQLLSKPVNGRLSNAETRLKPFNCLDLLAYLLTGLSHVSLHPLLFKV
jgi:hypothetical protein